MYKTVEISPINSNKNDRVGAGMLRRKEGCVYVVGGGGGMLYVYIEKPA